MSEHTDQTPPAQTPPPFDPQYDSLYANNVYIEISEVDLKLFFGTLHQSFVSNPTVDWHTAVSMPWIRAKIFNYYLSVSIASHEAEFGDIKISERLMPDPFPSLSPGAEEPPFVDKIRKISQDLLSKMKITSR